MRFVITTMVGTRRETRGRRTCRCSSCGGEGWGTRRRQGAADGARLRDPHPSPPGRFPGTERALRPLRVGRAPWSRLECWRGDVVLGGAVRDVRALRGVQRARVGAVVAARRRDTVLSALPGCSGGGVLWRVGGVRAASWRGAGVDAGGATVGD